MLEGDTSLQFVVDILQSLAILLALGLVYSLLLRHWRFGELSRDITVGALFGGVAVFGMMAPVLSVGGYSLEARWAIVALAAVFGGPVSGIIACALAMAYRYSLGDVGALPASAAILISLLVGLVYYEAIRRQWARLGFLQIVVFGVVLHVVLLIFNAVLYYDILRDRMVQIAISYVAVYTAGTAFLGAVLLDVRKRQDTERALRLSEARFRAAYDNVPIGMVETDEKGIILAMNPEAERIYRCKAEDVVGGSMAQFVPDTELAPFDNGMEGYVSNVVEGAIGGRTETVARRADGDIFPMLGGIGEMEVDGMRHFIGLILDQTDVKEMERRLMRAQKMEAVGQLTGGIAHDFNNILGIVIGNLELMEDGLPKDHPLAPRVEAALRGAQRGAEITRKLLSFARQSPTGLQSIQINDVVRDMQQLISRSLTVSIHLELRLGERLWLVLADPGDLQDAMLNLALNARDAMPDGGEILVETRNITFEDTRSMDHGELSAGDYVLVRFCDTGAGMPEDVKARVLEPFFSTKDVSQGSGLGLPMVYGFVQRCGGEMEIRSEPGKGTEVRMYLPRSREAVLETQGEETVADALPHGDETVLVVDDEEGLTDLAQTNLGALGYQVVVALDAAEALRLLDAHPEIDLLFTDIVFPGSMDGYRLAAAAWEKRPDLKVLVTSGYARQKAGPSIASDPRLRALERNMLQKPYTLAGMAVAVRRALDSTVSAPA